MFGHVWTPFYTIPFNWGEKLIVETLTFAVGLWSVEPELLVCEVWRAAQSSPGATFARASSALLARVGLPEV